MCAYASGATPQYACNRRLRNLLAWRPPDQAGSPAATTPAGGGAASDGAEVTRSRAGAGVARQEADTGGSKRNWEEMERWVQEEAGDACQDQLQDDDGFRQFKRRLTDSFFAFMRSDQPWLMYRQACELPPGLDAAQSDASGGGERLDCGSEWDMAVSLVPWMEQLRDGDRSCVDAGAGRGSRAPGEETVLDIVRQVAFRASGLGPDLASSEHRIGIGGGSVRDNVGDVCADGEHVEDGCALESEGSSGSRLEPAGFRGQSLVLAAASCKDGCTAMTTSNVLPLCRSLRCMFGLDQELLTEVGWKLRVRRLTNWSAELSVITGISSGGVLVEASHFSLCAGLMMSRPSLLDGEESSQQLESSYTERGATDGLVAEEDACVLLVQDDANLFSGGHFLRPDLSFGGDDVTQDTGGVSDANSDLDTRGSQEQGYVTVPVDLSHSANIIVGTHIQAFPSKPAEGWQTSAACDSHSSQSLRKRSAEVLQGTEKQKMLSSDGWLTKLVGPLMGNVGLGNVGSSRCSSAFPDSDVGMHRSSDFPIGTLLRSFRNACDGWKPFARPGRHELEACEGCVVDCAHPDERGQSGSQQEMNLPVIGGGSSCQSSLKRKRDSVNLEAAVSHVDTTSSGPCRLVDVEVTCGTEFPGAWRPCVGEENQFRAMHIGGRTCNPPQDFGPNGELNIGSRRCEGQDSAAVLGQAPSTDCCVETIKVEERNTSTGETQVQSGRFVLVGGVGVKADLTTSDEGSAQAISSRDVHCGESAHSAHDKLNLSSDRRSIQPSIQLKPMRGMPGKVGHEDNGQLRTACDDMSMSSAAFGDISERRNSKFEVDVHGVEEAPNTQSHMPDRTSSEKRARRNSNLDVNLDGAERAPNSRSHNVDSASVEKRARRTSALDVDLDGVQRTSKSRSHILTSAGTEQRAGKKNKLDVGRDSAERMPNSRPHILDSASSEKRARKKVPRRWTRTKGHYQTGTKVGDDKQTSSSLLSVKAERDLESPVVDSAGRDPVFIVLSDSSSDDEVRERSKSSRADSQRPCQIREARLERERKDQTIEGKKFSSRLPNADEDQGQPKYECQSGTDSYDQKGCGKPWYPTHTGHGHHQHTVHHERTQQSLGLRVSTSKDFGVRPPRPLQQSKKCYLASSSCIEEGKWSAWVTCDLCGNGPSLAYGEWYAWCCGKTKSRCFCLPESRLKLPQKSSKPLPRVVGGYVHRMCAIWSAECYWQVVEQDHYMQDLSVAVKRGLSLKCAHCQKFGATLGCRVGRCRKSFHYPCADLLASRLQLRMWEGCSVAVACKDHQLIDTVCETPVKLATELRILTHTGNYIGKKLICIDLSDGQEAVPIPCTNDVDNEPLPRIKYITKCRYLKTGGVMRQGMCPGLATEADGCNGCSRYAIDDPSAPLSVHVPLLSSDRCDDERFDWQHQPMYGRLSYDDFGRLQLGWETTDVIECNVRCKCSPSSCKNRVLQNGLKVRLELFKTTNRGWGVRTIDDLARGTFVVEYVGELLTHDEAEERGRTYDANNHSCLFNLDHPDVPQDEILVLDGHTMSNVARFVNHSCDGNLMTCRVYTESIEKKFCRIGMYANRDIRAGTELSYDYNYSTKDVPQKTDDVKRVLRHPNTIRCRCGALNCRKVLWRGGP